MQNPITRCVDAMKHCCHWCSRQRSQTTFSLRIWK